MAIQPCRVCQTFRTELGLTGEAILVEYQGKFVVWCSTPQCPMRSCAGHDWTEEAAIRCWESVNAVWDSAKAA